MEPRVLIVFYHPKDPKNVEDIARVAAGVGAELVVVPRPGSRLEPSGYRVASLEEVAEELKPCYRLLLETYGFHYLHEARIDCKTGCIALILGAEDYGVPRHVADVLEPHVVARIPMAVEGMSYNVAASATMGLYEVVRRCALHRRSRSAEREDRGA